MDDLSSFLGGIAHWLSGIAILGALANFFPPFAAAIALIYYSLQIYESRTFQHWNRNRQMKSRARRLARLRADEKIVLAKIEALEKVRAARVEAREIVATAAADAAKLVAQEEVVIKTKVNGK